ncbi:MAG: hypothetical protein A3K77_07515 [Euryarchaeota archaeon RBG_13_31_8]|nr:MAG: hypothetical protein A3K77_07515 [Euryarchaeota archaeon RBG_13_31_8]
MVIKSKRQLHNKEKAKQTKRFVTTNGQKVLDDGNNKTLTSCFKQAQHDEFWNNHKNSKQLIVNDEC